MGMSPKQKYIRGLYTGGTLADEALIMFDREIGGIYSNNQTKRKKFHTSRESPNKIPIKGTTIWAESSGKRSLTTRPGKNRQPRRMGTPR